MRLTQRMRGPKQSEPNENELRDGFFYEKRIVHARIKNNGDEEEERAEQ